MAQKYFSSITLQSQSENTRGETHLFIG